MILRFKKKGVFSIPWHFSCPFGSCPMALCSLGMLLQSCIAAAAYVVPTTAGCSWGSNCRVGKRFCIWTHGHCRRTSATAGCLPQWPGTAGIFPAALLDTVLSNISEKNILKWKRKCFTEIGAQGHSANVSLEWLELEKRSKNPMHEESSVSHRYP